MSPQAVTNKQIDAILAFLDRFEAPGFSAGKWSKKPGQLPWFNFEKTISEFQQALYDNAWINPSFDWMKWQDAAKEYVDSPEKIESADAETIQRLFTTHVRADRFVEGNLASLFEQGHVVALLRRLRNLRRGMGASDSFEPEGTVKSCNCHKSDALGFTGWKSFQEAAGAGENGFDKIPHQPGVYCLRVAAVGEKDPERIISRFLKSPMYEAFLAMADRSEKFFLKCGFRKGWGWNAYQSGPTKELAGVRALSISEGKIDCPVLYIGRSSSLNRRMSNLMEWAHPFNHPLWALLYSGWQIHLAVRSVDDYGGEEKRLKEQYRAGHKQELPLFMKR